MKPPHRGRGNRNAAKSPEVKRVSLSLRVLPETRERLRGMADGRGLGRVVDGLTLGTQSTSTVQSASDSASSQTSDGNTGESRGRTTRTPRIGRG